MNAPSYLLPFLICFRHPHCLTILTLGFRRFTPLLLDHSEYYFRRLEAVAVLTLPIFSKDASQPHVEESGVESAGSGLGGTGREKRCVKGTLHVCGNGVLFEPV